MCCLYQNRLCANIQLNIDRKRNPRNKFHGNRFWLTFNDRTHSGKFIWSIPFRITKLNFPVLSGQIIVRIELPLPVSYQFASLFALLPDVNIVGNTENYHFHFDLHSAVAEQRKRESGIIVISLSLYISCRSSDPFNIRELQSWMQYWTHLSALTFVLEALSIFEAQ